MKIVSKFCFLVALFCLTVQLGQAQRNEAIKSESKELNLKEMNMQTYLIERDLPAAGELSKEQLKGISQQSCTVIEEIGPGIKWLHSYVTADKVYCLYQTDDVEKLRKHADKGGFPLTRITPLATTISPETAKE